MYISTQCTYYLTITIGSFVLISFPCFCTFLEIWILLFLRVLFLFIWSQCSHCLFHMVKCEMYMVLVTVNKKPCQKDQYYIVHGRPSYAFKKKVHILESPMGVNHCCLFVFLSQDSEWWNRQVLPMGQISDKLTPLFFSRSTPSSSPMDVAVVVDILWYLPTWQF